MDIRILIGPSAGQVLRFRPDVARVLLERGSAIHPDAEWPPAAPAAKTQPKKKSSR